MVELKRRINGVLDSNFSKVAAELRVGLNETLIHTSKNPILQLDEMDDQNIKKTLINYQEFIFRIIGILTNARNYLGTWKEVKAELGINIAEESGRKSLPDSLKYLCERLGRPAKHSEILVLTVSEQFGLNITKGEIIPATHEFLYRLENCFRIDPMFPPLREEYSAGVVYALETTAIPELEVLEILVRRLEKILPGPVSLENSSLYAFLKLHLDVVEQDHSDGLVNAMASHINTPERTTAFENGFDYVVEIMEKWWTDLTKYAILK